MNTLAKDPDGPAVLRTMIRIRAFETKLAAMFKRGQLPGFVHLSIGQEATAAGTCAELRTTDRVATTHRGHGHMIAKGADPRRMMAEILGREAGYCRGMGGSMHLMDAGLGFLGANGIVGAGIPLATGAGIADQILQRDHVTVVFFGDGASNTGNFFESMNLASIWELPTVYICENNLYTEWMRAEDITAGPIHERVASMGMPHRQIDGNDVEVVRAVVAEAVARARSGSGPSLIEMMTYRWMAHNEGEEVFSGKYRPAEEIKHWRDLDPIARFTAALIDRGDLTAEHAAELQSQAEAEMATAAEFASESAFPPESQAFDFLYTTVGA